MSSCHDVCKHIFNSYWTKAVNCQVNLIINNLTEDTSHIFPPLFLQKTFALPTYVELFSCRIIKKYFIILATHKLTAVHFHYRARRKNYIFESKYTLLPSSCQEHKIHCPFSIVMVKFWSDNNKTINNRYSWEYVGGNKHNIFQRKYHQCVDNKNLLIL